MQIDRSRHLKSREISATSLTRDPKSKLYSRAALLSEESDLVFPFFSTLSCHDLRKLPLCPTTKGSNRCHVIIFYLRSLSLPASVAARKTTRWIKETGIGTNQTRSRKGIPRCCSSAFTLEFLFVSRITFEETAFELLHSLCMCAYTFE